jgi:hypothetical protein
LLSFCRALFQKTLNYCKSVQNCSPLYPFATLVVLKVKEPSDFIHHKSSIQHNFLNSYLTNLLILCCHVVYSKHIAYFDKVKVSFSCNVMFYYCFQLWMVEQVRQEVLPCCPLVSPALGIYVLYDICFFTFSMWNRISVKVWPRNNVHLFKEIIL